MTSSASLNVREPFGVFMLLIITGNLELIIAKMIWQFCALLSLNKRWQFGDSVSLKNCLVIWLYRIARSSLAILRQSITKQAMPFGDHLLLKQAKQFGYNLSLNTCWQLGNKQSLSESRSFITIAKQAMPFGNHLSLNKVKVI
jgi:hypothetical protein